MLALEQICSGGMFLSCIFEITNYKSYGFFLWKNIRIPRIHLIGSFFSFPLSHLGWDTNLSEERKEMRQICKHTWQWCGFLIYWLGDLPHTGLSMLTQYLCQVLNMVSCCLKVSSSQRFLEKTNFPLPLPIIFSLCEKAKEFIPWWENCLAPWGQPPPHRPGPSANSTAAALIYSQGLHLLYGQNQPHGLAWRCTKLPENNVSLHSTTNRRKIRMEGESHWVRSKE